MCLRIKQRPLTIRVVCPCCRENANNFIRRVSKDELKVRHIGYKCKTQYYAACAGCGTDIIIPEADIPKYMKKAILKHTIKG